MTRSTLHDHLDTIRSLTPEELQGALSVYERLTIAKEGDLQVCYAPFDHINPVARVVLIGITPGKTQMLNAIRAVRRALDQGETPTTALAAAKRTAAFSGDMRPKLVEMLDSIGLHKWLGIASTSDLFGEACHLVHTTSALRNPVFKGGDNYRGTPNMTRHPILRSILVETLGRELSAMPNAVCVPLGDKVLEALLYLADLKIIPRSRILAGLPHPSPANSERIAYFVGKKARSALSRKTNAEKLDRARVALLGTIAQLA